MSLEDEELEHDSNKIAGVMLAGGVVGGLLGGFPGALVGAWLLSNPYAKKLDQDATVRERERNRRRR